jgi:alkaline phosphatase D
VNRREVLAGLGAAAALGCAGDGDGARPRDRSPVDTGAAGPAPARPPEPPPWEAPGAWDEAAFAWGVAAGDPLPDGALLWTRTTAAAVDLVVMAADGDGWVEVRRDPGLPVVDEVVTVAVDGLSPDTAHAYVFVAPDGGRSRVGRFRTAPAADAFRQVVIGAVSCLGGSDPGFPCLGFVAPSALDAFLLLGDTVYADGSRTVDDYRAHWREVAATPTYQDAVASAPIVAIWDDHEVENNWTTGAPGVGQTQVTRGTVDTAVRAFREAIPMRLGPGGSRFWRAVRLGPVALFVADCRGERTPGRIVSDEQLEWLVAGLARSDATFKVVLVSVHAADHAAVMGPIQAEDRWQGYPAQRDALVAAAEASPGTLFLTGDMHYGAIQKLAPAGAPGAEVLEIAAGPAGSTLFALDTILGLASEEVRAQYLDVLEDWSWARLTFDPGERSVRVELIDGEGAVAVARTLAM